MKHLRKFDSVADLNAAIANSTIGMIGLAYNNGIPVIKKKEGGSPVPVYSTPFYIENAEQKQAYVKVYMDVNQPSAPPLSFEVEYSYDAEEWASMGIVSVDNTQIISPAVNNGQRIYLRANTPSWLSGTLQDDYIDMNEHALIEFSSYDGTYMDFTVGGNIMSLIYGDNFTGRETTFPANTFGNFYELLACNSIHVIDASELILPATELTPFCYFNLLQLSSGTTLENSPILAKANTLASNCYSAVSGLMYGSQSLARTDSIAYVNNPLYNPDTHGYAVNYAVQ